MTYGDIAKALTMALPALYEKVTGEKA